MTVLVWNDICLLQTGEVHSCATSPGNYNRFVLTWSMSRIPIWSCQTLFCQKLPGDKTLCFQYDLESNYQDIQYTVLACARLSNTVM